MVITLVALITALMVAVGAWLLRTGVRGRAVPGVIECTACRFDLSGTPLAVRCPECGGDLTAPRSSRPRRLRSRPRIATGAAAVGLPVAAGATIAVIGMLNLNLWTRLPNWALRLALLHSTSGHAASASKELITRTGYGSLGAGEGCAIIADLDKRLEGAGGPPRGWTTAHSEYFQFARALGWVSDEEWVRFVERLTALKVRTRGVARSGSSLPIEVSIEAPLLASYQGSTPAMERVWLRIEEGPIRIQGREHGQSRGSYKQTVMAMPEHPSVTTSFMVLDQPPGMVEIEILHTVNVMTSSPNERVLSSRVQTDRLTLELLSPGVPAVAVNRDPTLREQIRGAIKIASATKRAAKIYRSTKPYGMVDGVRYELSVTAQPLPCDAAFDVYIRPADGEGSVEERLIGQPHYRSAGRSGWRVSKEFEDFDHQRIDVILRSSIEAAELSPSITTVWIGPDIIFEDIELSPEGP